jgi:hypothetical protein
MDDLHEFRMGTNDSRRRTIPVALLSQKDNIQYKSSRSPCLQSTLDSGLDEFSERALDQGYTPQLQKAPEPKEKNAMQTLTCNPSSLSRLPTCLLYPRKSKNGRVSFQSQDREHRTRPSRRVIRCSTCLRNNPTLWRFLPDRVPSEPRHLLPDTQPLGRRKKK